MTPRQRWQQKVHENAPLVDCACGCGEKIKSINPYGRRAQYANGHNGRKYEDPTQYKREWNHRNRSSRYEFRTRWSKGRKRSVIYMSGGKCTSCGIEYDGKNACIFQFHHRDPPTKETMLSLSHLVNQSWSRSLEELLKCDLVCANCHFQIHSSEY